MASFASCTKELFTDIEIETIDGELKTQSDIFIDKQPEYNPESKEIVCKYRIHHYNMEFPEDKDAIKTIIQYGNIIESYWVDDQGLRVLARQTVIKKSRLHPDLWYGEKPKYKPTSDGVYWLEIYERNPWKNKELLLEKSKKVLIQ